MWWLGLLLTVTVYAAAGTVFATLYSSGLNKGERLTKEDRHIMTACLFLWPALTPCLCLALADYLGERLRRPKQ